MKFGSLRSTAIGSSSLPSRTKLSIVLCNDYRHASPPARSKSWGVVDVPVDFTGLAIICPHRSS